MIRGLLDQMAGGGLSMPIDRTYALAESCGCSRLHRISTSRGARDTHTVNEQKNRRGAMALADFSLAGKRAIVVGGRRNMGKGFALGLAEAGADVIVTDVNNEDGALQSVADEIAGIGRRSLAVKTDISQKSQVDELVTQAMDVLGGVDILMNVAVRYHRKSVLDLDDQDWDDLTNVNLKGYWHTHQAVAPIMQAQGSGSIINLTSWRPEGACRQRYG